MSTSYKFYCELCECYGPWLKRSAGGIGFGEGIPGFLIEHEFHGPVLLVSEAEAPVRMNRSGDGQTWAVEGPLWDRQRATKPADGVGCVDGDE